MRCCASDIWYPLIQQSIHQILTFPGYHHKYHVNLNVRCCASDIWYPLIYDTAINPPNTVVSRQPQQISYKPECGTWFQTVTYIECTQLNLTGSDFHNIITLIKKVRTSRNTLSEDSEVLFCKMILLHLLSLKGKKNISDQVKYSVSATIFLSQWVFNIQALAANNHWLVGII